MAKQKGDNNNNNNDATSSKKEEKEEKKPRNKKSSLSFSPPPISSPSVQTIKWNSRNLSTKNLPTSPNDVQVNFHFPLNIKNPYLNVQGAFPFWIPSSPDISKIGKKEIVGYHYKLYLHLPCWEMTDSVRNKSYKAWLHHEGTGLFVMMPLTGGCFIKQMDKFHDQRCDMTRHRLENFLAGGTNKDIKIIVFYEFPNNIICSNKYFNSTKALQRPADKAALLQKTKLTHNWLYEPGANKEEPNGVYKITGGILWEMEIIVRTTL